MEPDVVVEDLRSRAGKSAEPRVAQAGEEVLDTHPQRLGTLPHLEWREAVDVHVRDVLLDGLDDRHVEVAGELGVDATLETHLRRSPVPGLHRTLDDLWNRQQVGLAPQVERSRTL